jgi:hypothetical protein
MREADGRGRRLAVISHELMNAHLTNDADAITALALLEEFGYGLMALPSITQPDALRAVALEHLIDQLQDYLRHGYTAIVIESHPTDSLLQHLDGACDACRVARPPRIRIGPNFRASLDSESTRGTEGG